MVHGYFGFNKKGAVVFGKNIAIRIFGFVFPIVLVRQYCGICILMMIFLIGFRLMIPKQLYQNLGKKLMDVIIRYL